MLIRRVADARVDARVGVARVVDEARGARHELAVDDERAAAEPRVEGGGVVELVEVEEVDVLFLGGDLAAAVGLGGGDDLADVAVYELALCDVDGGPDAWGVLAACLRLSA